MQKYFLTVEWCKNGKRGIFAGIDGLGFNKDTEHTWDEMTEILGPFFMILDPKSEPFTEEQIKEFNLFIPLAEYKGQYGIVLRREKCGS